MSAAEQDRRDRRAGRFGSGRAHDLQVSGVVKWLATWAPAAGSSFR